ncbi:hypothetical protein COU23_00740 [Candidatus Kuenenbacteria bacterium CG10_big_fil_rev_8_21_14_0_10_36_11]|uniref:Tim44-like domain-containing protein n=1 Tax=Candidatus Kuenenbacteria bacterium CG10_big_fil_rev_8_21_14_0_10_36_11 TaxID=1974618 RepID=A0A2M6WB71_9BACT|nr:MAG: hypothetical protein COU23_00740 [Candidatus Kuenenbacteria bacterium CG10_big_fil_rev_8_21_14_0_10_36_11]
MSNRKIYIILIILLLIALGLLGVFWYLSNNANKNNIVAPIDNNALIAEENKIATKTPVIIPENKNTLPPVSYEEKEKAQLQQLVSAFVERYGSYSNQTDFENLTDLMPFMSQSLKRWAENLIDSKRVNSNSQAPYYGVTTKVLKTEIIEFTDELVKIKVATQKSEMFGTDYNSKVSYEDLTVSLIKEEGVWKVNEIKK